VLQILFTLLHIMGIKAYFTYLKIAFGIAILSIFVGILVLIFRGSNFVESWNGFVSSAGMGLSYDKVIETAVADGFNPDQPFSLSKTLAMMPLVFWIVGFFNGSPQIGGEVKRARSTQFIAQVVAVMINGAIVALLAIMVNALIGGKFLACLGYLFYAKPDLLNMGVTPDFNFMISVLSRSAPVIGLMGLGYLFWAINGTPNIIALVTRSLLAYSFDRMAPEWVGDVSEKYHTPVKAIIFTAVMGLVAVAVIVFVKQASLLSSMMAQMFTYLVMAVAAILFPYKFPKLWESSTSARKVFGIPLLTITGVGSLLVIGLMSYYFGFYSMFGANTPLSLTVVAISIILCAIYYYAFRAYQKGKGIDVDLAYKEIPPE
jgi:amino acid transporter